MNEGFPGPGTPSGEILVYLRYAVRGGGIKGKIFDNRVKVFTLTEG
jgi:hypothetical protein